MDPFSATITLCNLLLIPLLICEAMRRMLKVSPRSLGTKLCYLGWNYVLSVFAGKELRQVAGVILRRDITTDSLQYTLCILFCSILVGFFTADNEKNISVSVEFQSEN